jgi:hypothetical protein
MIHKPAVIARTPLMDGALLPGDMVSNEEDGVGMGAIPPRNRLGRILRIGCRGVVCNMCNRTSVLAGASDLSDLGHVDRRVPPFRVSSASFT